MWVSWMFIGWFVLCYEATIMSSVWLSRRVALAGFKGGKELVRLLRRDFHIFDGRLLMVGFA